MNGATTTWMNGSETQWWAKEAKRDINSSIHTGKVILFWGKEQNKTKPGTVVASGNCDSDVKCLPTMQETQVWSLGWDDPLEKEMATHSSILAWRIPWTEEPGGLQSMGLQRVGHDWVTNIHTHTYTQPIYGAKVRKFVLERTPKGVARQSLYWEIIHDSLWS